MWKVELHNKVENAYALEVTYQDPFNPDAEEIQVPPLKTLRTDAQKGYLVVMSRDRLRVRARSVASGLKPEDARRIPRSFGVEDLSNAILCYRTTHPNYWLGLSVVRHESAATLPATVDKVRLTSVVSDDDQMVTRAVLDLVVGDLRFLETVLPRDSRIWSNVRQRQGGQPVA